MVKARIWGSPSSTKRYDPIGPVGYSINVSVLITSCNRVKFTMNMRNMAHTRFSLTSIESNGFKTKKDHVGVIYRLWH